MTPLKLQTFTYMLLIYCSRVCSEYSVIRLYQWKCHK